MPEFKIAVLDDYQRISKAQFSALDPSKFEVVAFNDTLLPYNHPDTPAPVKDELVKRLEERTPFPAELIARLPNLRLLLTTGTRNASLDLPALQSRGIPVAGTADLAGTRAAGTDSTTQHCVALILALARDVVGGDASVKSGGWQTGFATGLAGKTLGVVGLGRLGVTTARIMSTAFGMRIVAWSSNLTQEAADEKARAAGLPVEGADGEKTFKVVSRDELFRTADVISVHLVLSDRSRGLITSQDLSKMKPSSFLVNTSRGPLIVEKDLLDTVKAGGIAGVALDVFDREPLPADSEWRSQNWGKNGTSRVLLTPHMGYVEEGAITSWYQQQIANIERWARGESLQTVLA
ncbi:D-3-phosphoglycerate dehydrogenase-like protein [Hapsidospora chrysogenum ATCC 11550]|uniref:D-3-phosphoglycerate dehydrogenase-like protein n=1 Tax=Hapsidospora chrysogenum (strain ATCC 11550 / CBS 779.69 / DSM 880 / IAM 14645 / JCM 23072 / IMI 49137) TaxID=857340 RepID=A0A086TCS4_HAPC1|nr:D-3-phosphoglycerate dehydrogenase-like protein [Hapsidospora chrysogenum ATCC 11550]